MKYKKDIYFSGICAYFFCDEWWVRVSVCVCVFVRTLLKIMVSWFYASHPKRVVQFPRASSRTCSFIDMHKAIHFLAARQSHRNRSSVPHGRCRWTFQCANVKNIHQHGKKYQASVFSVPAKFDTGCDEPSVAKFAFHSCVCLFFHSFARSFVLRRIPHILVALSQPAIAIPFISISYAGWIWHKMNMNSRRSVSTTWIVFLAAMRSACVCMCVCACSIYCAPDHFHIIKQWWGEIIISICTGNSKGYQYV